MKSAVLITGASRGFGRCLAIDFARELRRNDLDMYLWARTQNGLAHTCDLVQEQWNEVNQLQDKRLSIHINTVDLSKKHDYEANTLNLMNDLQYKKYNHFYLVHNAGSLGELNIIKKWNSINSLGSYWELNVLSAMYLNHCFLQAMTTKYFRNTRLSILNITSLCALEPFPSFGLYCSSKAAREMHHKVIAMENIDNKLVQVLNYSPGPMDTDMQKIIQTSSTVDNQVKQFYIKMKQEGTLLSPQVSSKLGVQYFIKGAYTSGSHVDYYDIT